ncbi:MAG: M2 family metallopeptidase [Ignavibacteria bacterium]|nr:M2 family metallopeptidase [Ignavibacteria bacterium]
MNSTPNFLKSFEEKLKELYIKSSQAYWNASINGTEENWNEVTKYQLEMINLFRDKANFQEIERLHSRISEFEPLIQRQIKILYNEFLPNQFDLKKLEEITNLQNKIENVFTTFRARYNGKTLTDNEVDKILMEERDTLVLQKVWEASKEIGDLLVNDLLKLVELRNEQAKYLGYENYHQMSLILSELDPTDVDRIFNQLEKETEPKFIELKNKIDSDLSSHFGININDLMPWHYQQRFFQEAPPLYLVNFDEFYNGKDLVEITRKYFSSIGLDIDDLIERSDLFERKGKNQHAFCISIDRANDVRVLCNVISNTDWMGTLLHEYGHAVYDKFIDRTLPFILRDAAHIFVTEAIAMLFGKFAIHPLWMKFNLGLEDAQVNQFKDDSINFTKMNQIIFARWVFVMYRFEKSLYENPNQDLNALWWELHKKYLHLNKPENRNKPDWTTKIHIATSPCYYHNYLLGEIFSSQLNQYLHEKILNSNDIWTSVLINNKKIGEYLIDNLFRFGSSLHWKEVIKISTEQELTTKYYLLQYIS